MLDKEQIAEAMRQRRALNITAQFDTVKIQGLAVCDSVTGAQGKIKFRAKFSHGIKAVLLLEEYGEQWEAREYFSEEARPQVDEEERREVAEERKAKTETKETDRSNTQYGNVQKWRADHREGSKKGCARDLGISVQTVRRHWEKIAGGE